MPFCSPWRFAQAKRERHARGCSSPGRKQMSRRGSPGRSIVRQAHRPGDWRLCQPDACSYRTDVYEYYDPWPCSRRTQCILFLSICLRQMPLALCFPFCVCVPAPGRITPRPRSARPWSLVYSAGGRCCGVEHTEFSDDLATGPQPRRRSLSCGREQRASGPWCLWRFHTRRCSSGRKGCPGSVRMKTLNGQDPHVLAGRVVRH